MIIAIGSTSERKIEAVRRVFSEYIRGEDPVVCRGHAVPSGVPETPFDRQTYEGAKQRAAGAHVGEPKASYAIGLESGLVERYGHIYEEAWAVCIDAQGKEYCGYSSGLKVPDYILQEMQKLGRPHYEVMTLIENRRGHLPNDTWGTYSGGRILRSVSLEEAIRNAVIQVVADPKGLYHLA